MNEQAASPERTALRHPALWRVRHAPAVPAAAMLLFLTVSALWLSAAGTASVWVHSEAPSRYPSGPPPPSHPYGLLFGLAGAVLTLGSLVLLVRWNAARSRPLALAAIACVGVLAEIVVVHLVSAHAFSTAPLGYENSGEEVSPVATLAICQFPLVAALAWGMVSAGPDEACSSSSQLPPHRCCERAARSWRHGGLLHSLCLVEHL